MLVMHGPSYTLSCVEHRDQSIFQIRGLLQVVTQSAVFISSRNAPPQQTMSPNKGVTAVHGCRYPDDMAVYMHEVPAWPWIDVRVPLALSLS